MRLKTPYPSRPKVDAILENLGDDYYHDHVHSLTHGDDHTAVAEGAQEAIDSSSDSKDGDDKPADHAPTTGEGAEGAQSAELEDSCMESDPLSAGEADAVHQVKATMAALSSTLEGLRAIG